MLQLSDTKVTDTGLKSLASLEHLWELDLRGTQVSDAGIDDLGRLPGLLGVSVDRSNITPAGVAKLRKMSPRLIVRISEESDARKREQNSLMESPPTRSSNPFSDPVRPVLSPFPDSD